jgi:hypothetical protein
MSVYASIASLQRNVNFADEVSLNPQPLPPKELFAAARTFDPLSAVALNPQPLPPKEVKAIISGVLDKVALNPQPLPPKETGSPLSRLLLSLDAASLNPQPLPPKESNAIFSALEKVALNPQPLPPKEWFKTTSSINPFAEVALNPQPLPPKDDDRLPIGLGKADWASLNPQPLPPKALNATFLSIDPSASWVAKKTSNLAQLQENTIQKQTALQDDSAKSAAADHRGRVKDSIRNLLDKLAEMRPMI